MTEDGTPRGTVVPLPRPGPDTGARSARGPTAAPSSGTLVAPPWQRIPGAPAAPVVALAARDGRAVTPASGPAAPHRTPAFGVAAPHHSPASGVAAPHHSPASGPAAPHPTPASGPAAPHRPLPAAAPGVYRPAVQRARPRVVEDPAILGLSRLSRGRVGSRLFTLFFVAVYALIAVQMVVEILHG